jgi:tRNA/rRNA methyltransferase
MSDATACPPAIVLVRPQLGMNIGMAARAMANFGLSDLRLVSPRDGWPNPDAGPAAAGADHVLADAQVFASIAEALHDCQLTYATSMIPKGLPKPARTPREAAAEMRAAGLKAGILFGPEAAGMSKDDLAGIATLVTVPTDAAFGSLNLAQTVLLMAYEWGQAAGLTIPRTELDPPAPHGELAGFTVQLTDALEEAGWFHVRARDASSKRTIAAMLAKSGWTSQEVRTWRGMIRELAEARRRRTPQGIR